MQVIGPLSFLLAEGDPRRIAFDGIEVLRRISYPVRDQNWGTAPVVTLSETIEPGDGSLTYVRAFAAVSGDFAGLFSLTLTACDDDAQIEARVTLTPGRAFRTNRAGFTLLHPLAGVAGIALKVSHPDGTSEEMRFPDRISAAQPAIGIAGLRHRVGPVEVAITMAGEVFEMEDQRNWSDASFKTYCRPLAAPRPFDLRPGEALHQSIAITLTRVPGGVAAVVPKARRGSVPAITLAADLALGPSLALPDLALPVVLRIRATDDLQVAARDLADVSLEIVLPPGVDPGAVLAALAGRCSAAGLSPRRVVALPEAYLQSHQPQGPWPEGPTPADLLAPLRAAFPQALAGSGCLTNFTEFNRCPPAPGAEFVTFGSTAIVHAADDLSVLETLEALPAIFRSATALAPDRPLNLGLFSIGMRSNPYGDGVAANPLGLRLPMARDDPRQGTRFAAAWAVGVLAAAAGHGVDSLALCMADGPLGCLDEGAATPLYHVIRATAGLAGQTAEVLPGAGGLLHVRCATGGLIAHLGDQPVSFGPPAGQGLRHLCESVMSDARRTDWLTTAPVSGGAVTVQPLDVLFLTGGTA